MSATLFEPYTIRGVSFRNRIVMSPMCMHSATADGVATDFHVLHYGSRALGGTGLIMTETAAVTPNGPIGPGDLGIWDDAHIPNLRRIVDAVHLVGGRIGVQIGHAGRQLGLPEQTAVAPSAIAWGPESRVPEELTQDGIAEIVDAFRAAAARAKEAGFDVVPPRAAASKRSGSAPSFHHAIGPSQDTVNVTGYDPKRD